VKKVRSIVGPIKSFAALIFTGMVCLYMVAGFLCDKIKNEPFNYSIPFIFVILWLLLSVMISVFWSVFFSDKAIKKWHYIPRLIVFSVALVVLLAACLLILLGTPWGKLWVLVAGCATAGVVVLSIIKPPQTESPTRN